MIKYSVQWIRSQGLQARWTKTRDGAPIIAARDGDNGSWYVIDARMWRDAERMGLPKAFESHTTLGHFFSVPA